MSKFAIFRFRNDAFDHNYPRLCPVRALLSERPLFNEEKLADFVRNLVTNHAEKIDIAGYVDCSITELFKLTNSIDHPWTDNAEVSQVNPHTFNSSTMVGDIFRNEDNGKIIMVCSFGFTELHGLEI
jgi:hypothetical protein